MRTPRQPETRNNRAFPATIIWVVLICLTSRGFSQPYIDLLAVRYINSPDIGKPGKGKNPTRLDYLNIATTIPIQFRNKKDAIVLSPFFEKWTTEVENVNGFSDHYFGLVLPVSFIKSIPNSKWILMTMAIIRMDDAYINHESEWQFGGAFLASRQVNKDLVYKLGMYANGDFFGLFVVPLVGIDWRINEKSNLFGVLPASLTYEYKLTRTFYTGAVFRTFTNSYYDAGPNYIRIDENELGAFLDFYPSKKILLNCEIGHSILRKIRSGTWHNVHDSWYADNNIYFKFALAYRFRLRP
jgi:hypothetical protein